MNLRALACALPLAALAAGGAHARTERLALIVANHQGGTELPELRYAGRDGQRLADVLVDLGGFERADILSVIDGEGGDVMGALDEVERRVAQAKRGGDEVVFLFYYSGHAQNGVLRLGQTQLEMQWIKRRLEESSADVRIAFVDSCGAGAMTREKGGTLAPPFVVQVDQGLSARGQVIITSSSASEVSQESDDIQGSFFTHYLATGLRGDADRNTDGKVTLDEAYAYAYGRTVAATSVTRSGAQHPTYSYDLRGAGDVTLSEPGGADVVIDFPAESEGRYFVVDLDRQLFVAEVDKNAGNTSRIALPKGQYAIKKRMDSHLLMTRLSAREKGVFTIDEGAMERVSFADDYAKGTPIMSDRIADEVGFALSVGLGAQLVLDPGDDGDLFPGLPYVVIEARGRNLVGEHIMTSADVGFGGVKVERDVPGGTIPADVVHVQAGVNVLWTTRLFDDAVLLGGGGRLAAMYWQHTFQDPAALPVGVDATQWYFDFAPGLVGMAGWSFTSWGHAEITARSSVMVYTYDSVRPVFPVEALASVWFDF